MSSKADDFDVRYRDGAGRPSTSRSQGVKNAPLTYNPGYDASGWDIGGYRVPASRPSGGAGPAVDRTAVTREGRA